MDRKPIFDAVRRMLGRRFKQAEVAALDRALDLAEGAPHPASSTTARTDSPRSCSTRMLGSLSEAYESGGRGPGAVSGGADDPGGISYGVYQLASKTSTCAAFIKAEGRAWAADWGHHAPGSEAFSAAWKAVAQRDGDAFRKAQHAFIERTHYRPVIAAIIARKGLDLDARSDALRDVVWSCAVQHGGAVQILVTAIDAVDRSLDRAAEGYDRKLIKAIYASRTAYVVRVAANRRLAAGERAQLLSIARNRYPSERAKALAALDAAGDLSPFPVARTLASGFGAAFAAS